MIIFVINVVTEDISKRQLFLIPQLMIILCCIRSDLGLLTVKG
jgi:hypothetical protein